MTTTNTTQTEFEDFIAEEIEHKYIQQDIKALKLIRAAKAQRQIRNRR